MVVFVDNEFNSIFKEAEQINLYRNGEKYQYIFKEKQFEVILNGFEKMIEGSRLMPAFGVSLNAETLEAMKNGIWVEFVFDGVCRFNDMAYEKLLVEVNRGHSGFNISRFNSSEGYHGRCFYLDLNGDMTEYYSILEEI